MNKTGVIEELVMVTGERAETCEIVVKGFEKVSEEALASKFHGITFSMAEKIEMVSAFAEVDKDICRVIMEAMNTILEGALENKLRFFRRRSAS